jgi:hypothetical protein
VKTETSRIEQHIKEIFPSLACLWWMERLNLNEMGMAQRASGPVRLTSQQPAAARVLLASGQPVQVLQPYDQGSYIGPHTLHLHQWAHTSTFRSTYWSHFEITDQIPLIATRRLSPSGCPLREHHLPVHRSSILSLDPSEGSVMGEHLIHLRGRSGEGRRHRESFEQFSRPLLTDSV